MQEETGIAEEEAKAEQAAGETSWTDLFDLCNSQLMCCSRRDFACNAGCDPKKGEVHRMTMINFLLGTYSFEPEFQQPNAHRAASESFIHQERPQCWSPTSESEVGAKG